MSLPTRRQGYSFLEPLRGKSAVFMVEDRKDNLVVTRFLLGCLAVQKTNAMLFDTSCFYGVNIKAITQGLPKNFIQQSTVRHFSDTDNPDDSLSDIGTAEGSAVLIDDLNAILHLLSAQNRKLGMQGLVTFFRILSYEAKINRCFVLGSAYKSKSHTAASGARKRSLTDIADLKIVVETETTEVAFRCDKITTWPTDGFRTSTYFEPST